MVKYNFQKFNTRLEQGTSLIEALIVMLILMMVIPTIILILLNLSAYSRKVDLRSKLELTAANMVENYWATGTIIKNKLLSQDYTYSISHKGAITELILSNRSKDLNKQTIIRILAAKGSNSAGKG